MKNIAVILAGGAGKRAGEGLPKQFRKLSDGRTVLETCVAAFEAHESIDEIAIVMLRDYLPQAQTIARQAGWHKVNYWIAGGRERWESSLFAAKTLQQAMNANGDNECNILLHDCARPFVSEAIITRVCQALMDYQAVSVAVPLTDTIYEIKNSKLQINSIPPRETLMRAQTPQAFRLSLLLRAYEKAEEEALQHVTDDAGVIHTFLPDEKIGIVAGEETNRKLTYEEDFRN